MSSPFQAKIKIFSLKPIMFAECDFLILTSFNVTFQELWSSMYQKWQRSHVAEEEICMEISNIKEYDKELKSKVIRLRK